MRKERLSKLTVMFALLMVFVLISSSATYAVTSDGIMAQYKHYQHKYHSSHGVDCIQMSNMLFNAHKKAGIPVRIIKYRSHYAKSGWHYSIQTKHNGKWVDANYRGFDSLFKPMSTKKGLTVVKSYG